ncbi:MAG: NCS2 family permease, partial [Phycisphaerae bacterium]
MFDISQRGSTVGREILGGITTFMAMSYIIFVQYGLLSGVGMDPRGVMIATCVASAAACFLMGWLANYPIALAP